jgi:hypothetical protein
MNWLKKIFSLDRSKKTQVPSKSISEVQLTNRQAQQPNPRVSMRTAKLEMPGEVDLMIIGLKQKTADPEADCREIKRTMGKIAENFPSMRYAGEDALKFTVCPDGYNVKLTILPSTQADNMLSAMADGLTKIGY